MGHTFPDILNEIKKKTQTSLLICVSMLAAGCILLISRHIAGWLFVCMGAGLAYSLYNKNSRLGKELSHISDMDSFSRQFAAGASFYSELLGLTITEEYAVITIPYLQIFRLEDMEKFEVGLQGDVRKALFLTDKSGTRHKIAETQKGDALQEEFDRAYNAVREYFAGRSSEEA